MDGFLESPQPLDAAEAHYIGFVIESDYKVTHEQFWTGYEPSSSGNTSFFRHVARDNDFLYIAKRASPEKLKSVKSVCRIVSLVYNGKRFSQVKKCPKTWIPTRKPTIKGKKLLWGGKRPYKIKPDRFLDFKLGKYKGYYIKFHFFSHNHRMNHWGVSK